LLFEWIYDIFNFEFLEREEKCRERPFVAGSKEYVAFRLREGNVAKY
jgi:hypothetical protein